MSSVKVKLDRKAVSSLILKGDKTRALIQEYGNRAYGAISNVEGYKMEERTYPERCGVALFAEDYPAISDNLENNTLLKAVK